MSKERRDCQQVIKSMLDIVPPTEVALIKDLLWNFEDAAYKPPEETLQWERTAQTLEKHIPMLKLDWHFDVISIFTTQSVEQLKRFENQRLNKEAF